MDRPGVRQVPEGSGEQGKMEKTVCKKICDAPTTFAVKGLMIMMMMIMMTISDDCSAVTFQMFEKCIEHLCERKAELVFMPTNCHCEFMT